MNLLFMVVIECNYYYPLLLVVTRLVVSRRRALCGSIVSCHVLIFGNSLSLSWVSSLLTLLSPFC